MKKAQFDLSRKTVYYIFALFILAFIVISMINVIKSGNLKDISLLGKSAGNLLVAEIVTSSNCFAEHDEDLDRNYPGIINLDNFNEERLNTCGKYFQDKFSVTIDNTKIGDSEFNGKEFSRPVLLNDGSFKELKVKVQNA